MNILFILSRYPGIGGIETVSRIIIPELLLKGHNISIASFLQEGEMDLHNVPLLCFPEGELNSNTNKSFLIQKLKDGNYDVIIYQDSYGHTERCVIESAKNCNVPVITFEHNTPLFVMNKRGLTPWYTKMGLIRRLLHPYLLNRDRKRKRYLLQNSFRYVLLSESFVKDFCFFLKLKEVDEKIRVIHNPALACTMPDICNKEKAILCVCQLNSVKRVDMMIRIWKDIQSSIPDWQFWIVGDGEERERLEQMVNNGGIPRIKFFGFQKPAPYYDKASIFWMTSKYEGWGLTLVEAMQRGCVPIAMDTYSSLRDIVDNGVNGIICPSDDLKSFAEETVLLISDDNKRLKMLEKGRIKTNKWSLDRVVEEWDSLLDELAKS